MNSRALKLAALLLLARTSASAAEDTLAVLSSNSGVYAETFAAFEMAYGRPVKHLDASERKPETEPGTRTVVAFGGKAAIADYPEDTNIIYCLAPGISLPPNARSGQTVKIAMLPPSVEIFSRLKLIQPALKRLRIFWMVPDFLNFRDKLIADGAAMGIEISAIHVEKREALPALLRESLGSTDAFWVPPDPLLLTPENIMILREFSWGNNIPFYASNKGVTREGAAASVGVSFKEIGETAARAAASLASGQTVQAVILPQKVELTLNTESAKKCGVVFPKEIADEAGYIFP